MEQTQDQDKLPNDSEDSMEGGFTSYFKATLAKVLRRQEQTVSLRAGLQQGSPKDFFWQVIEVFKNVNYFNLLASKACDVKLTV